MQYYYRDLSVYRIKRGNIVDLCSGNGVIPLFLSARTKAKIIGVELQDATYMIWQYVV